MNKKTHINTWYFVAAAVLILLIQNQWTESRQVEKIAYSEFQSFLEQGRISEIAISDTTIRGTLKEPLPDGHRYIHTIRVDPDFAENLQNYDVTFTGVIESNVVGNLLSWILPAAVFIGLWFFFIRKVAEKQGFGGLMSVGKSKAKVVVEKDIETTFNDVAGVDEAKEELQELVTFLKDPVGYGRLGAHIPKGVLLVGPPGTGKTLIARAVAGEAGVVFFSINGSEFVEMFVGVGAARVRDLFVQARQSAPCIIFIDELDALGRMRGISPVTGGSDEKEQTLNQLLAELDGFDPSTGVVLLAATNRPEILDPALLRAGRFDRQVLVDRPDKSGRVQILAVHVKKVRLDTSIDLEQIAALTAGFSGADLANLVNEAALLATRRRANSVMMDDFTHAVERIVAGLEKRNRLLNENERRFVAYHEMGHAIIAIALPGTDKVHKVSIIPRGVGALGYTIQRPTEDRYLMTRQELTNKLAVLLGGRAAEKLIFDHLSTGAADDLAKATEIARGMAARYGMDETVGFVSYDSDRPSFLGQTGFPYAERQYSEATAEKLDEAVKRLVSSAFDRTIEILKENRRILDEGAGQLLEHETLDEAVLADLCHDLVLPTAECGPGSPNQSNIVDVSHDAKSMDSKLSKSGNE